MEATGLPTLEKLPQEFMSFREEFRKFQNELSNKFIPQDKKEEDVILNVEEAADLLNLATPTIYTYVKNKTIPFMKRSKRLYFSKKALLEWLKDGTVISSSEIDQAANNYIKQN